MELLGSSNKHHDYDYCREYPDDPEVQAACVYDLKSFCESVYYNGFWVELTDKFNTDWWFALLEISSAFCNILFFIFVYYTPALQAHPMKLIMYLALAEFTF